MHLTKKILLIFIIITLTSCVKTNYKKAKVDKKFYASKGFALIYDDSVYNQKIINKKINNEEIIALHSLLKKNTSIKIINPVNSKIVETKIVSRVSYPKIFNIVISKKVATDLKLDFENPYVEIIELKENEKFVAEEGTIFDEEKNVAEKAPVDEIKMDDLSVVKSSPKKKEKKRKNYILIISDFYYSETAYNLKDRLQNDNKLKNLHIKKINDKKYRLFVGPFKNFNALKSTYISLNNLGFEDLNIIKK